MEAKISDLQTTIGTTKRDMRKIIGELGERQTSQEMTVHGKLDALYGKQDKIETGNARDKEGMQKALGGIQQQYDKIREEQGRAEKTIAGQIVEITQAINILSAQREPGSESERPRTPVFHSSTPTGGPEGRLERSAERHTRKFRIASPSPDRVSERTAERGRPDIKKKLDGYGEYDVRHHIYGHRKSDNEEASGIRRKKGSNGSGDEEKIYATLTNIGGTNTALSWALPLLENYNNGIDHPYLEDWTAFKEAFLLNFDDPTYAMKANEELMSIQQGTSVHEYATRFRSLAAQVTWDKNALIAAFKKGLKPNIKQELVRATLFEDDSTASVEQWIALALKVEGIDWRGRNPAGGIGRNHTSDTGNPVGVTGTKGGVFVPNETKELRRKEGRCLKCGRRNHVMADCRSEWQLDYKDQKEQKKEKGRMGALVAEKTNTEEVEMHNNSPNIMVDISGITEQVETLIDSGSTCNFINITFARKNKIDLVELPKEKAVRGINGKDLPTPIRYKCLLQFRIEGREFRQKFYAMPLGESKVILGMEWLRKAEPIILWNPLEIRWEMEEGRMGALPVEISDFDDVFSEEAFKELPPHRRYDCQINLKENHPLPKPAKIYPMSPQESKACQEYIKAELADGKIQKSNSPIAAPAFFVPKADGSLRLVIDYRKLNEATISDQFPIPRQDDLVEKVKNAKIFTKLDLRWGYNNIRIREGDKWKTAFRTKEGLYEYKVMPFGLKNGPATFQRFMNELFEDLLDICVVVYLDDILIFSKTREEHTEHLREVLERLRGAHLFCKETKCHFFVEEVVYIGIVISPEGVSMEKDKIRAIQEWMEPRTVKEVQSFLGFANFYRRFVNNFSLLAKPLTRLTRKEVEWKWGEEEQAAFEQIKEAISRDPVLRHPNEAKPYFLETDASGVAMGAILSQRQEDGYLHPIAYLSQSFNDAQCNYDTHDKELCAIITALEGWRYLLEGTEEPITIYTDHRNLEYWAKSSKFNRRHARWYQILASFNFVIVYRPGKMSSKPDLLSRRSDHVGKPLPEQIMISQERFIGFRSDVEEDELEDVAERQGEDPSLEDIIMMVKKKPKLSRSVQKGYKDYEWEEGLLYYRGRIVIPEDQDLRNKLLWKHHDHPLAGHQGRARTLESLGRRFWWANMKAEVGRYVDTCPTCQHTKGQKIKTPLKAMDVPMGPWEDITYDMIVKLPKSNGWDSILVVVDRFSKMAHFLPCNEKMTAEELAGLFVKNIWKLHGTPKVTISDRGTTFTSKFLREIYRILHIEPRFSTAYHLQTDGQSERVNQWLEGYLRSYCNYRQSDWAEWLPMAEFVYNNSVNRMTGKTPFEIVFGKTMEWDVADKRTMNIRAEEWGKMISEAQAEAKAALKFNHQEEEVSREFVPGEKVLLLAENIKGERESKKLDDKRMGPFEIKSRVSSHAYELDLPGSMKIHPVFHISLLTAWKEDEKFKRKRYVPRPIITEEGEEVQVVD
ncbi:Retrotransposable element Tf2 [Ceratobasidium theobromae]|uniref:Retrotransposable element Tf2 n=1 Tax=Ceratobasidium theobromae TaxID=1582974 RepID=A0A5N5Q8Y6_9AGAM|nr:Retrotransposable element Tf2 [Ceratobasidium theobromae]